MRQLLAREAFVRLSLHAKMQQRLDEFDHYRQTLQGIEEREIRAYDDNDRYAHLEALKNELLNIRFLEEEKREALGIHFTEPESSVLE